MPSPDCRSPVAAGPTRSLGMTKRISFLLLAAGLAVAVAAVPAGAVSGGRKAAIGSAPYIAWLPSGCTGTLIAPDRVLTAGHCLEGFSPLGYSVIIGKDGNSLVRPGADRFAGAIANGGIPARAFAIHPKFKESFPFAHRSPQNAIALDDVGLILLAQPVSGITPVKVAGAADRAAEKRGETASIFGYGLTGPSPLAMPKSLRTGHMSVISAAACNTRLRVSALYRAAERPSTLPTVGTDNPVRSAISLMLTDIAVLVITILQYVISLLCQG